MKEAMRLGGVFHIQHVRDGEVIDEWDDHNLVVTEGLNHILDTVLHGTSQVATWYVGLFEANYTPQATDTGANIAANATESSAYDETTRVAYVEASAAAGSTTNSASKATFTINATKTMYGAFLASTNTKTGVTGTLLAATKFTVARSVVAADQLLVTYTFTAADSDGI